MLSTIKLSLFLSGLCATAFPALNPRCNGPIENTPWRLTDIVAFNAASPNGTSSISFDFCDSNAGIQLDVTCSRQTTGTSAADPNNYYPCSNDTVIFIYSGDELMLKRSYIDECVGSYPYDEVDAFGHASTNFTLTKTADGVRATMTELDVPITSEAS